MSFPTVKYFILYTSINLSIYFNWTIGLNSVLCNAVVKELSTIGAVDTIATSIFLNWNIALWAALAMGVFPLGTISRFFGKVVDHVLAFVSEIVDLVT